MQHDRQLGSVLVIVTAVLFVALMAALGVIFYQNFVAKSPSSSDASSQISTEPGDPTIVSRVAFVSNIYAIDHPGSWTVNTKKPTAAGTGTSTTTLTDKDGAVQVVFSVSETSPMLACDKDDGLKISYYKVHDAAVTKLTDDSSLFVTETINDAKGGGYVYAIGLTPDGGDTHAAVGNSHCNVTKIGYASTVLRRDGKLVRPTIVAKIAFPKLDSATKDSISSMQPVKDLLETDSYKIAVKILESIRKE